MSMSDTLHSLLNDDVGGVTFSLETKPVFGDTKTWTFTMVPDEDEENAKHNSNVVKKNGGGPKKSSVDNPDLKKCADGGLTWEAEHETVEAPAYVPKKNEQIVRILLTDKDVASATMIHDNNGLTQIDALNSMLVAFCREASAMMNLDFPGLLREMSSALYHTITESTVNDIWSILLKEGDDDK